MALVIGLALGAGLAILSCMVLWPAARRRIVGAFIARAMARGPLPMPYHTFLEDEPRKLLAGSGRLVSGALDDKLVARINRRLKNTAALHLETARRGLQGAGDAAEYLVQAGLASEAGLDMDDLVSMLEDLEQPTRELSPASDHTELHVGGPPPAPVICPAEFEGAGAVLVSWPVYYPTCWATHRSLVEAVTRETFAIVLVPSRAWRQAVELYCSQRLEDGRRLRFIIAQTDDVWTRDYGPTGVLVGSSGTPCLVSNPYALEHESYRRHDADAAHVPSWYFGLPEYRLPLVVEGGNLMTDGAGTFLMASSVLDNNPDVDRAGLRKIVQQYLGCDRLIIVSRHKGEPTGHIDMTAKFVGRETVLVAGARSGHPWARDFDAVADLLSRTESSSGGAYQVVRLPVPSRTPSPLYVWGYVNSLVLRHTAIIPVFGVPEDMAAVDVYRTALPDHRVVAVDFSAYPLGAAHCQTKEYPAAFLRNVAEANGHQRAPVQPDELPCSP